MVARGRRVGLVLDVGHILVIEVGVALVREASLQIAASRLGRSFEVWLGDGRRLGALATVELDALGHHPKLGHDVGVHREAVLVQVPGLLGGRGARRGSEL